MRQAPAESIRKVGQRKMPQGNQGHTANQQRFWLLRSDRRGIGYSLPFDQLLGVHALFYGYTEPTVSVINQKTSLQGQLLLFLILRLYDA